MIEPPLSSTSRLQQLLWQEKVDVAAEGKRLQALIRDWFPDQGLEANLLLLAARENVPARLREGIPPALLITVLQEKHGLTENAASKAALIWKTALGFNAQEAEQSYLHSELALLRVQRQKLSEEVVTLDKRQEQLTDEIADREEELQRLEARCEHMDRNLKQKTEELNYLDEAVASLKIGKRSRQRKKSRRRWRNGGYG